MKLEDMDLDMLAGETIDQEVARPLTLSCILWLIIFFAVDIWLFWDSKSPIVLGVLLLIFLVCGGFHFQVYRHERDIVLSFRDRISTFQQVGEVLASCGVNDDEFKLVGEFPVTISGFRGTEDGAEWLAEEGDDRVKGQ